MLSFSRWIMLSSSFDPNHKLFLNFLKFLVPKSNQQIKEKERRKWKPKKTKLPDRTVVFLLKNVLIFPSATDPSANSGTSYRWDIISSPVIAISSVLSHWCHLRDASSTCLIDAVNHITASMYHIKSAHLNWEEYNLNIITWHKLREKMFVLVIWELQLITKIWLNVQT